MSWLVENIILDRYAIRDSIYTEEDDLFNLNLDSDDYLTLLTVEEKIKELFNKNILTRLDVKVLEGLSEGKTYSELAKELRIYRTTVKTIFRSACEKIAFALGGEFTNEGLISSLVKKHKLNEEQTVSLREFIERRGR